ncbi:MAG: bifunctional alpha,alpha-trehalose-phosphate synthase (UDP-forming)/trehalose-phosphatase [Flavobacteriales bacterium]|nr:bifunctional alpha,alpha-trehalose-phosphate synthase (UDP-forming)/trehalose-phosphatase [Bacteroidales bacterium AH-315-I05]PCJ85618.1 MAG: bifunctional alpha,alpha-trehalose-phosphate synthase (UDP-forming)/trehalose-phosphatase [Flavobacteriales bacterium]
MSKTLIISNRLPVSIKKEGDKLTFTPSTGGLATGLGSIYKTGSNLWIGWPGLYINKKEEKESITNSLQEENMLPVFLTEKEIKEFYEGFSNETLWPAFHYFNQYVVYEQALWEAYVRVNQKFANEVIKAAEPSDTVWVHDYQLLLLPQMVREKLPDISIGFFQHIPFPSYEAFRQLPWRRELLYGMLGADLLGFHTYDDMRHFLSAVNRLAGISYSQGEVIVDSRPVMVDAFPMGIDYDRYADAAALPETLEREKRYRSALGEQKLILSMDRLDYSKGIPQRLAAFELFLERHPEFKGEVSLLLIVVPSRDNVGMYKELKETIDEMVGRINGKYGRMNWMPIHYFYRSYPLEALSAFYRMANVALVTPMRDGMNLVCKEFIASKLDQKGVLILSEMAGSAKELSDAILINPNNINQVAEVIHQALVMPIDEQIKRNSVMQKSLKRYSIHHWVDIFMSQLAVIKEKQKALFTKKVDAATMKNLKAAYQSASHRLIFLDYDGTLMPFTDNPMLVCPDETLIALLKDLTANKKNKVVIISGRGKNVLEEWLGAFPVDLVAEHGGCYKEKGKDWEMVKKLKDDWKKDIGGWLKLYVDRTPGSFVENKEYSLVWHYRKVETGLGELRAREIISHLKHLSANENLQVVEGNMIVEVKRTEINKGRAASKWLKKNAHDFVLSIGDDFTDEDMFKMMPETAFTIKVGSAASEAKYSVKSPEEVRKMLRELITEN